MPEQEELTLVVTLDDRASAQLANLRATLASAAQGISQAGAGIGNASQGAHRHVAALTGGLQGFVKQAGFIGGVVGGITSELTKMGVEFLQRASDIQGMSLRMVEFARTAREMGTSTAQLKSDLRAFREAGVPIEEATKSLMGFSDAMVDLGMVNNQLRTNLLTGGFLDLQRMQQVLGKSDAAKTVQEQAEVWRKAGHEVKAYWTAIAGPAAGAKREREFFKELGTDLSTLNREMKQVEAWQKVIYARRDSQAAEFTKQSAAAATSWENIAENAAAFMAQSSSGGARLWAQLSDKLDNTFLRALGRLLELQKRAEEAEKAAGGKSPDAFRNFMAGTPDSSRLPFGMGGTRSNNPGLPWWLGGGLLNRDRPPVNNPPPAGGGTHGGTPPPGTPSLGTFPALGGGRAQHFSGNMAGMPWAVNPASDAKFDTSGLMTKENIALGAKRIEFRDAEGNLINRDNAQRTEENTAELKRLNDAIIYSQQGVTGGDLAGKLGMGALTGGGGMRFPGGGSGPGIGSGDAGGGGGATFGGGQGGGAAVGGGGGFNAGGTINPGQVISNAAGGASGGGGAPGDAVDTALKLEGLGERKDRDTIKSYLSGGGAGLDPATTAWCAAFVNSSLQRHGIKGTGSAVATSFLKWGQGVAPGGVQKGDVLVQARGRAPGQTGGHVGLATGETRTVNGQLQYEMLAGNQSDAVRRTWQAASGITARRAIGDFGGGAGGGVAGGVQGMPGTQSGQAPGLRAGPAGGQETYQKMLNAFSGSSLIGKVPPDGARFGIRTGSAEEWARFGTAVAKAESNFNPRTANTSDPGGSFGILQYAHKQVPGGNAYNVDASISAFVRDAQQSVGVGSLAHGLLGRRFSTIGRHPDRTIRNLANYPGMVPGGVAADPAMMPPGAQLTQGQMPGGTMGGVPVQVTAISPNAAQVLTATATSAANATAAAIKAGATPEQAAAAGAAAAAAAHGRPPPGVAPTRPDPEKQKQDQRAADDARRDSEDDRRQAEISRQQRLADREQIRKEERAMTPEQRRQARQERKEREAEEQHTREGEKLQRTAERRDARAKRRQADADRRLEERAQGERDPAGRNRPLRRQTESQRTGQKPWSKMTPQERADTLRDQQIEADRKRAEEEQRRAAEDEADRKLKESRKSVEEIEEEAARKLDPEGYLDRESREQREREGKTPLEEADERREAREARAARGRDPTAGFSKSAKALDASGRGIDAAGDTVKVQADGTLKVDVRAAKGTSVAAKGEGAFKKTVVERSTQMEHAGSGPDHDPDLDS